MKRSHYPHQLASRNDKADWLTFWLVFALCLVGILMIFNASHIDALIQFGDKFRYAKLQFIWLIVGLFAMAGTYLIPLELIKRISPYFMFVSILLLILVLIPGIGSQFLGARRWLILGNVVIQPSEIAKLAIVMYLPTLLPKKNFLPSYLVLMALVTFLVIIEPDMGTAVILAGISLGILYLSGLSLKKMCLILISIVMFGSVFIMSSPYRLNRVKSYLDPKNDPHGTSYHLRQILISLGSGGFSGTGFGRSRQKFQYLPEATTDSIFAVIAEETGFLGAGTFIGLLLLVSLRLFNQASKINDQYTSLLAFGVSLWFSIQICVNLAAMVSLIPLTGVPLPFISYGGSALLSTLLAFGLYLNATRFRLR